MDTFGNRLRAEREKRGLELDEIARVTRVRLVHLEALERNDFDALPGDVFVKGFVKMFAECLGIDPQPVVEDYLRERHGDAFGEHVAAQDETIREMSRLLDASRKGHVMRYVTAFATGSFVLLAALAGAWWIGKGRATSDDTTATRPVETGNPEPTGATRTLVDVSTPDRSRTTSAIQATRRADSVVRPAEPEPASLPIADARATGDTIVADVIPTQRPSYRPAAREAAVSVEADLISDAGPDLAGELRVAVSTGAPAPPPVRKLEREPVRRIDPPSGESKQDPSTPATSGMSVTEHGVGTGVVDRSLTGRADRFEEGGQVWFWTRVEGAEPDATLYHVWLRDGVETDRVALRIGGPHWRTQSRKTLWSCAAGAWTVEARDAHENVLARDLFSCVAPATD